MLNHLSLVEFIVNCNIKSSKKHKHSKIICWVSFNFHKELKNLLLLFKPFHGLEDNFLNQHVSWKDFYFNVKNDIEKIN